MNNRKLARDLLRLARRWRRLKEDKGDTEYHIVKLVLENHPAIVAALAPHPSPRAKLAEALANIRRTTRLVRDTTPTRLGRPVSYEAVPVSVVNSQLGLLECFLPEET